MVKVVCVQRGFLVDPVARARFRVLVERLGQSGEMAMPLGDYFWRQKVLRWSTAVQPLWLVALLYNACVPCSIRKMVLPLFVVL